MKMDETNICSSLPEISLPDIQNNKISVEFQREIPKVGIRNFKIPISILMKEKNEDGSEKYFNTIGTLTSYSNLSSQLKGTNMSRYSIVLMEFFTQRKFAVRDLIDLLDKVADTLKATDSYIKIEFDYLIMRQAPKSKILSYFNIPCEIEGYRIKEKEKLNYQFFLTTYINYTSLCPCSKEISKYGAHNQRSEAIIKTELLNPREFKDKIFYIEDIVDIVEKNASAPIRNTLKRIDEKYQTELMYENPRFVEDMVRFIAVDLDKELNKRILNYSIEVIHYESIHQVDAVAFIHSENFKNKS